MQKLRDKIVFYGEFPIPSQQSVICEFQSLPDFFCGRGLVEQKSSSRGAFMLLLKLV